MSVPFDYYWNLRKEGRADFEKYRARSLPERFKDFKADKILYEKHAKSVNYHPFAGRYDNFFAPFWTGKKYKPGKLIEEPPQYPSFVYFYKGDTPVFVGTWSDPKIRVYGSLDNCRKFSYTPKFRMTKAACLLTETGHVYFDFDNQVPIRSIYRIRKSESSECHLCCSFMFGNKIKYPDKIEQYIISGNRRKLDIYSIRTGEFSCTHLIFDGPCDSKDSSVIKESRDSEYIDVSSSLYPYYLNSDFACPFSDTAIELIKKGYKPVDVSRYRKEKN